LRTDAAPPTGEGRAVRPALAQALRARLQPQLEQLGRKLQLDTLTLLPILVGSACLVLLVLATLLKWNGVAFEQMRDYSGSARGVDWHQGKCILVLSLGAAAALAVGVLFLRPFLPTGLLLASAAATCALVLVFAVWVSYSRDLHVTQSLYTRHVGVKILGEIKGVQFLGFYLALLTAGGAAAALTLAGVRQPRELPVLRRWGAGPFTQRYGGLIGAQVLAVLLGLIVLLALYTTLPEYV
jgi:hypothetical protein